MDNRGEEAMVMAQGAAASVAKRGRGGLWAGPKSAVGRQQERLGWLLIAPSLLVVFGVAIYPLYETVRLSFTNTRKASERVPRNVGWENYSDILHDDLFWRALKTTMIFTVSAVTIETVLGMIIALTINSSFRGRGMVRTSMLVPWAIPTVVSSLLWDWMFNATYGVVNGSLKIVGLMNDGRQFAWITDAGTAIIAVVAIDVWKTTPFMALLLLAGLQVIPGDVYEASYVDGASRWQQFWQITLPLVRPALLVALIFRTMDTFRIFDLIYVLNAGSTRTMTIAIYVYQSMIESGRVGYGSAGAVIIFICIGLMVVGYSRLIQVEEN